MPKTIVLPRPPPVPARPPARPSVPLRAAVLLLAAAMLGACASTPTPADSGLSGRWRLDAAASDNVNARVKKAVDRVESRLRRRRGDDQFESGTGPDDGLTTSDQFGDITRIGPDFRQLRERLLQALDTPPTLQLEVQPGRVAIQSDGLPARDYQPGERFTRVDEYGTAALDSRWIGNAFVLQERYTSGARLAERYQLGSGGTLVWTRSLTDPIVGKLELKSVYRRSPNGP